ncbi:hypothetical protein FB45DRAFT_916962 [Roridomyces roridus]|uniref:Chitin-binding type-4 domain-containing protein n=1 Tax=Roridomyces roridus TaxID=1738132 RepID=A0AAD7BUT0_9AGAR|nr:hypothetical protein FB45DRAFT_916962 [Roridomyces roridus]
MVLVAVSVFLLYLPAVLGHARVSSPPIRSPGSNFLKTCGQTSFNSVQGDPTGHITERNRNQVNAGCDLTLCRGMPFSDVPAANIQTVKPSQAMAMSVDCTIPARWTGECSVIGSFLSTFDDFCPTSGPTPADQTNLQFTLPNAATIGSKCQTAGDCVVQLFWATPDFSQNYYYCVDVQMAAAAPPPPATTATPVALPTTTASPTTVQPTTTALPTPTTTILPPPLTTQAVVNAPAAVEPASSSVLRMVTSVANAANAAAAATGLPASGATTPSSAPNTNAGRRRARILWF